MGKRGQIIIDLEAINEEKKKSGRKEEFDEILKKIKKMSEAIELHENVKKAVSKEEIDTNYLSYVENSLEDKLFNDARFDKIRSKVLLEIVCPELTNIENFDIEKLEIEDLSSHYEENDNYIDKLCTYNNEFVCLFGVCENNPDKAIKYEKRKFVRCDMIEALCQKIEEGKTVQMDQYDEYYVVTDEKGLKVYSERKVLALVKLEETIFDKIKNKLTSLFSVNKFNKKKFLPNLELIYDTNSDRLSKFKTKSKVDAKARMKTLLSKEREVVRNTNI